MEVKRAATLVAPDLMAEIRDGFALSLDGIHGESHWARVCENGLLLAERTGADPQVVEFFAYLHDSQRLNDGADREHGQRAADYVRALGPRLAPLSESQIETLAYACHYHTAGLIEAELTVQVCWDADRLDLGRVGITPHPARLCTPAAREPEVIEWALRRSWGLSERPRQP